MFEAPKNQLKKILYYLKIKKEKPSPPPLHTSVYQKIIQGFQKKRLPNLKQLLYLPKILTSKEQFFIKILFLAALVAFIFFIAKTLIRNLQVVPSVGGSYTEAVIGEPQYINPLLASSATDLDLIKLVFSGLVKYDHQLKIIPDLAKSYEINPEKNVYKFYLKDNLFWHDETRISADDILFTYEKLKGLNTKNPFLLNLQKIKIKKSGEAIEFHLETPNQNFLNYLILGIIPKHIWQNIKENDLYNSQFNLKPIGSGPFKFKSITKTPEGQILSLSLERFPNYHLNRPLIKTITFKVYQNFSDLAKDLTQQKIDGISYSPVYFKNIYYETNLFKNYSLKLPHYVALFFNLREDTPLRFKEVRQALASATPKEKILQEVLSFEGQIIHGPILPENFGFKKEIKTYEFSPEKAIALLEKNGWQKDEEDAWLKDTRRLEISLLTVDQPDLKKTAEIIRDAWHNIGIRVKLIIIAPEHIEEVLKERKYTALLYGVVETFGSDPFNLWHSSQINYPNLNLSGFSNKRVDKLLEKGRGWPFEEVRRKKYAEFQDILSEEVPAIFLHITNYNYLITNKIKGLKIEKINLPADRFNNVNQWYIKTKISKNKK